MTSEPIGPTDVLRLWRSLACLEVFDLDAHLTGVRHGVFDPQAGDRVLPWQSRAPIQQFGGTVGESYAAVVSLGLFVIEDLATAVDRVCPGDGGVNPLRLEASAIQRAQRRAAGTRSCHARLPVSQNGIPQLDRLEIACYPWAAQRVLNDGVDGLRRAHFDKALDDLRGALAQVVAESQRGHQADNAGPWQLTAFDVAAMTQAAATWSGVELASPTASVIELTPAAGASSLGQGWLGSPDLADVAASIEWVRANQAAVSPLVAAISDRAGDTQALDVRSAAGIAAVCDAVGVMKQPRGRWPVADAHSRPLMEQCAINQTRQQATPLVGVTAPAGNGSESIIQDLIAAGVVARADVLARGDTAEAVFGAAEDVVFPGGETCRLPAMAAGMRGHDVLLVTPDASRAVGLHHALISRRAVAEPYRAPGYLTGIAEAGAGITGRPWGLLSLNLSDDEAVAAAAEQLAGLWQFRRQPPKQSFAAARQAYRQAGSALEAMLEPYDDWEQLSSYLIKYPTVAAAQQETRDALTAVEAALASSTAAVASASEALAKVDAEREHAVQAVALLQSRSTWWRKALVFPWLAHQRELAQHQATFAASADRHEEARAAVASAEQRVAAAAADQASLTAKLATIASKYQRRQLEAERLQAEFGMPAVGPRAWADAQLQTTGPIASEAINRARSQLLVAGLALHEAWIHESLQSGAGLGGYLKAVVLYLNGERPRDPAVTQQIWQALFWLVPSVVMPVTAVSRVCAGVPPETVGQLVVVDGGRLAPSRAVGALWRAQRAVVLGDVRLAQPPITQAPAVAAQLATAACGAQAWAWSPLQQSLQHLAHRRTALGTDRTDTVMPSGRQTEGQPEWLGLPLAVSHCTSPELLDVSNQCGYDGWLQPAGGEPRLTTTLTAASEPTSGSSSASIWYQCAGKAIDKQFVAEQADALIELVLAHYRAETDMPSALVLTPFTAVAHWVQRVICSHHELQRLVGTAALQQWCAGAVHACEQVQGQRAATVWFLLGCDASMRSAAESAAQSHALSVALSAADQRLCVIGDQAVWAALPGFATLVDRLEVRSVAPSTSQQ